MEYISIQFAASRFVPVAIGFFGLGTGSFIWGGQALFGFPRNQPGSEQNDGNVGVLDAGLHAIHHRRLPFGWTTWFNVFGNAAPLYMAGLAFTAYGIHWFAMADHRDIDLKRTAGWLDGDRVPLPEHSGSGRFPARGKISGNADLCRPDFRSTRFRSLRAYYHGISEVAWWGCFN